MKFYKAGRKIRDVADLEEGKVYSVCGIAGVFRICAVPENASPIYNFSEDIEGISLTITREALLDRINMGFVYAIRKIWQPRPKTILKYMENAKK